MVKHIVMFKLAEKTSESMEKVISMLKEMVGKIETLRHLEVGVDFRHSERSYDLVLTTHFDHRKGLDFYSNHPVHKSIKDILFTMCSSTIVVDYET